MDKNEMTENKENVVIDDFDFSLIADFFKRVERQGPGGEWETRLATSLIPDFKRKIRIADMGCGKGSQTFVLADEYDAEIDAVEQKIHQMAEAGYEPYAHFILPETCWTENYYAPMKPAMEAFLKDHPGDPKAQVFINRLKEEIAYYEENKDCFGYVFYIGRKV